VTQAEILQQLKTLPTIERLALIEAALHLTRQDLQQKEQSLPQTDKSKQLAAAAQALLPDYTPGSELTIFTALDGEDFHA
jgi:hypothetical protein